MSVAPSTPEAVPVAGPSLKGRLLRGGFWVIAGKVVTATSTVLIAALVAKLLPPEAVGIYFIGDRLIWLVAMLALLGLNTSVVRIVAEAMGSGRPGRARAAVALAYRWVGVAVALVVGGLLAGGGTWLALHVWRSPGLAAVMPILSVWAGVHTLQVLSSEVFRGFQDLKRATIFGGMITGGLTLVVLGGIWFSGADVTLAQVMLLFACAAATSLTIALALVRRKISRLGPSEPIPAFEVRDISLPLWINGLMAWALTQCDVLILGIWLGEAEVAVYGAAAKLVSLVLMSLMLVNLVVPPFIAELHTRGQKQRLERMLRLTATIAGLPAFAVLGLYLVLGPFILETVFDEGYRRGAMVLAILSVGRLVTVCAGSGAVTLSMTGHQQSLLRITLVTSVMTVGAMLLAVGPFGGVGVAVAVAAGVSLQAVCVWLAAHRHVGVWTHVAIPKLADIRELMGR